LVLAVPEVPRAVVAEPVVPVSAEPLSLVRRAEAAVAAA
jgi:hypothetical protein